MPKNIYYSFGDVSINEFANAETNKSSGRIRKKIGNIIKTELFFELPSDDDENVIDCTKKLSKLKVTNNDATEMEHVYNHFSNDIWYLIAEHIQPENVQCFALICKQTYAITTTMKFWKNLYRRYYKPSIDLPVRLQHNCMTRPGGFRACTIRSLFYTYPLFVERLQAQSHQDTNALIKRQLIHFWYEKINASKFLYFYKLKRKSSAGTKVFESEQLQRKDNKAIKALCDMYMNSEEGCCLLIIESTKFHPLPRLDIIESDVLLASINNHLSRSCSHYRLEINFKNVSGAKIASVGYEPAASVKIYDWWIPTYAKYVRQGFQPNLEYLRDEKESIDEFDGMTDDDAWDYVLNNF